MITNKAAVFLYKESITDYALVHIIALCQLALPTATTDNLVGGMYDVSTQQWRFFFNDTDRSIVNISGDLFNA